MEVDVGVLTAQLLESSRRLISEACSKLGFGHECYASYDEFLMALGNSPARILVMQLGYDCSPPLSLQQQLRRAFVPTAVVYLTTHPGIAYIIRAIRLGGTVLTAECNVEQLCEALYSAADHHDAREKYIKDTRCARQRLHALSPRRREVLDLVLAGEKNKQIALRLGVNIKTVEKHRDQIRRQTGTTTLPELVRLHFVANRPLEAAFSMTTEELNCSNLASAEPNLTATQGATF